MFQKSKEIQGHAGAIYSCTFDGKYVYTGSADKFVTRWNLKEGTQDNFAIKFEQSVYALEINQTTLFVGLSDGSLHIFDLEQRKELKFFTQHKEAIFSIAANPIKAHLYVGDADGNVSVWDLNTFELLIYIPLNAGKVRDIAVEENGERFALACQDGTVRIFESSYFNEVSTINAHKDGATSVLFQGNQIISGGKDAMIRLWNLSDESKVLEIPAHNYAVYGINQVGDSIVSISRDKTVKVWSNQLDFSKRLDLKEGGHRHSVNDMVVLNENEFTTVGDDKRIILWSRI
ncbi:MAG: WD40 repeat protein [Crocinitomicaceae bacterium]|jgi:WD40 repeat protein